VAPAAIVAQDVAAAADQPSKRRSCCNSRNAAPRPQVSYHDHCPSSGTLRQRRQRAGALALLGRFGEHGDARMYWIHPPDEAAKHELIAQIAHAVKACQQ
jgi:hypothetical protein